MLKRRGRECPLVLTKEIHISLGWGLAQAQQSELWGRGMGTLGFGPVQWSANPSANRAKYQPYNT